MPLLPLLFVVFPILELWVLIRVGVAIGAGLTIGLVVLSAMLGIAILNRQGFRTLARVRARVARGEEPSAAVLDGMVLAVAGLLLLIPGFLTDVLALLALIPALRAWLVRRLLAAAQPPRGAPAQRNSKVIEGEYERED
ncbi:MAG: FxsA family protein [Porticoccaceae bacterium]|nr:MAG: FxsA family protein [Porticoccaceae bacterium]